MFLFVLKTVPKFIDPVFVKTSPKRSFLVIENERFGLVFAKTGSINSGTDVNVLPVKNKQKKYWRTLISCHLVSHCRNKKDSDPKSVVHFRKSGTVSVPKRYGSGTLLCTLAIQVFSQT
jgi:hypothetical protein